MNIGKVDIEQSQKRQGTSDSRNAHKNGKVASIDGLYLLSPITSQNSTKSTTNSKQKDEIGCIRYRKAFFLRQVIIQKDKGNPPRQG